MRGTIYLRSLFLRFRPEYRGNHLTDVNEIRQDEGAECLLKLTELGAATLIIGHNRPQ